MTWRRRLLGGLALFVAVVLVLPLAWWQFLGPDRFRGLDLGIDPTNTVALEDLSDVPFEAIPIVPTDVPEAEPVQHIELPPLTMSSTTVVTVIFSVGSSGMSQAEANRLNVGDLSDRGKDKLTDSIMLLISDQPSRKAALLSLPRDVWLSHRGHRINETFARRGAQAFVDDVSQVAGVPVHHLVQANFTAFADLVDGVGGVNVYVAQPMADLFSALYIPEPGCWLLDGPAALAYARSRQALTSKDGGETWRTAAGGNDFSRIKRQQSLVAAAWDQMRGPSLVRRLPNLIRLADGLTIDAGLGVDDVVDLAKAFKDVAAGRVEGHTLPTFDRRIGQAQVLGINYSKALPLYKRLRSWPPGSSNPEVAPEPTPTASAEPSAASSGEATATPSKSESAAAPIEPAPAAAIPSSACSRSDAYALPNPRPYLRAISERKPVPYYDKTRAKPREEPSEVEASETEPKPGPSSTDQPSDEPTGGPTSGPQPEPSPEPSSEPEGGGLILPTGGDGEPDDPGDRDPVDDDPTENHRP